MDIEITGVSVQERILPFDELHAPGKSVAALSPDQNAAILDFNAKIRKEEICFESVACLCGSRKFVYLAGYDRFGLSQSTVMCKDCGLVQSNPRMTSDEYARFYSSDTYRRCYDSADYLEKYEARYSPQTGQYIFQEIRKVKEMKFDVSVLEIGAGGGWNLVCFRDAGASVLGIDYSPSLVELGKAHGIAMKQGDVASIQGQHDVIIMNHVFEHLLDPLGTLEKVKAHLKSDGVVYIGVPNFFSFPLNDIQNAHVYYFDPLTFSYYCMKAGFLCVAQGPAEQYHMFGIFKSSSTTTSSNLDGHGREVLRFMRRVKRRRQMRLWMDSIGIGQIAIKFYRKFVLKMN